MIEGFQQHTPGQAQTAPFHLIRFELRESLDASMSCDIATILTTEIHLTGHAIRNLLAAQGRGLWSSDIS